MNVDKLLLFFDYFVHDLIDFASQFDFSDYKS